MRILMLSQFYPPIIGGAEQHVRALSIELARCGHDVAVVTMRHQGQAKLKLDHGVRVYSIRSSVQRLPGLFSDGGRQHSPPFPDPEMMLELRRIIRIEKPQIVHAHNRLACSFLPLKAWSKARLVITLHDYNLVCATETLMYHETLCDGPNIAKCLGCAAQHYGVVKGTPTVLSNLVMGKVEQHKSDMFVAVSQAVAVGNGLVGSCLPFQVIPNFLPNQVDVPRCDDDSYFAQLPTEDYLLFVGALSRAKGVDVLLEAYNNLTNAPPLVLIGYETSDWSHLVSLCTPNVFVLKNWPHTAVMKALTRSLMVLAPSVWPEPCSTVVMEAMSTGCPVIATRTGGMSDLVADGETGLLVQPNNSVALQQAIGQLLGNPSLRNQMGKAAQHKAIGFRVDTVAQRIEAAYREVLPL